MTEYGQVAKIAAGVAGLSFLGYCVYFDHKRRSDPLFKQKLRERRTKAKKDSSRSNQKLNIPDLKDQNAIQKFFLDSVAEGEQYLAMNDYENCVRCLTQAIAVCGQPQQLLTVFRNTLPPNVFQMLLANLSTMGEDQTKGMAAPEVKAPEETDGLD